jgi:hypothetical protein
LPTATINSVISPMATTNRQLKWCAGYSICDRPISLWSCSDSYLL